MNSQVPITMHGQFPFHLYLQCTSSSLFFQMYLFFFFLMLSRCHGCVGCSLAVTGGGCSPAAVRGLLLAVASLVVDLRFLGAWALVVVKCGLSSCSSQALQCRLNSCGTRA